MSVYRIGWDGNRAVLPTAGQHDPWDISDPYSETAADIETFIKRARSPGTIVDTPAPVELHLVHRPDNEYDPNAISVAIPGSFGGTLDERHLGYIYGEDLYAAGGHDLADLAEFAGGWVICTGLASSRCILKLDLPEPRVLRDAIDAFFTAAPVSPHHQPRLVGRPRHVHTESLPATSEALELLRRFPHPALPVTTITVTGDGAHRRHRSLLLRDAATGRRLGTVTMGHLLLEDERDRDNVLVLLQRAQIPVTKPTSPHPSHNCPADYVPSMTTDWGHPWVELKAALRDHTGRWPTVALFHPSRKSLAVQDSRLLPAVLTYVARLGLPVADVRIPRRPWHLYHEVPITLMREEATDHRPEQTDVDGAAHLLRAATRLATDGHQPSLPIHDKSSMPDRSHEPPATFLLNEAHVAQRQALFGQHQLTDTIAPCQLCAAPGRAFTAPISIEQLTYCQACLERAATGLKTDRTTSAAAVARLGKLEFDNTPMLESQLSTLHIDPTAPVTGRHLDELLLLRFTLYRGHHAWTRLLIESGLAGDGIRGSRGTTISARDGHLCLSLGEKAVCDFLHQHDIEHAREPRYPAEPSLNPGGLRRADWLLADGTFVELWGLPDDPTYAAKMKQKRQLAARHGLTLVELTAADLPRLPEVFAAWLPPGNPGTTTWTWSPVRHRQTRPPRKPRGASLGRNSANTLSQNQRRQRCLAAVEMQLSGMTRADIAQQFGTSVDSVKILLRDGKFYTDPASHPTRKALADHAAQARADGVTQSHFRTLRDLTLQQAEQAWRDAAALTDSDRSPRSSDSFDGA